MNVTNLTKRSIPTLLLASAVAAAGCSQPVMMGMNDMTMTGTGDGGAPGPDMTVRADLRGVDLRMPPDFSNAVCTASPSYSNLPLLTGELSRDTTMEEVASFESAINNDATPDYLVVEMYAGFGVFANRTTLPASGTFTLSGEELNYATCGVCVFIFTDINMSGMAKDPYFATGGTFSYTTTNGQFKATLTNLTFEHVEIDPNTFESTPHADGCQSAIASAMLEETVMPMPDMTVVPTGDMTVVPPGDMTVVPGDLTATGDLTVVPPPSDMTVVVPDMGPPDMAAPTDL